MGCCCEFLAQQFCLKHKGRSHNLFDDGETNVLIQARRCPHPQGGVHWEYKCGVISPWEYMRSTGQRGRKKQIVVVRFSQPIHNQFQGIMMYLCIPQQQAICTVQNHASCYSTQAYTTSDSLKEGTAVGQHCDWLHIWGLRACARTSCCSLPAFLSTNF